MNSILRFFLCCALVALPVSASDISSGMQELFGLNGDSIPSSVANFFTPSAERLALQKLQLSQMLSAAETAGGADSEQFNNLKKLVELSIQYEEELLRIYTEMLRVKAQIDAKSDSEATEELRAQLRALLEEFKAESHKRDLAVVEAGLVTAEKAEEILELEETKFVKNLLSKVVLGQFDNYI